MPIDEAAIARITEELSNISIALAIIALNQSGADAANADERKRYDDAKKKCASVLLTRIEGR